MCLIYCSPQVVSPVGGLFTAQELQRPSELTFLQMPRTFGSAYSIDYHIGINRIHLPTLLKRRIRRQDWRPLAHRVTRRRCDWVRPTAFQLQLSEETTRSLGALRNSFASAKVRYDISPAITELRYSSTYTNVQYGTYIRFLRM